MLEVIDGNLVAFIGEESSKLLQGTRKYSTPKGVIPQTTHPGYVAAVNSIKPIVTHSFWVNDPCYYAPCVDAPNARYSILIKEERFRFIRRVADGRERRERMNSRRTFAQSNTTFVLAENTLILNSQTRAPDPARLRLDDAGGYTWECGARKSRR